MDQDIIDIDDDSFDEELFNKKTINKTKTINNKNKGGPNDDHLDVLSVNFGHTEFRPLQWKIISTILNEKRDVCAIMATGYGKSLCFQFPPVYKEGIAIVISPLISLMEDQVLSLTMSNIPACLLGSAQTKKQETISDILTEKYRIIYVTPEFSTGDVGFENMKAISKLNNITLIAIDEAHCVSKWGHDFRPHYRHLWKLRNIFKNVPIIAVTATATPHVQEDIISSLKLKNPLTVSSSFDRPNLFFEVIIKSGQPLADLSNLIKTNTGDKNFNGSTIIYCLTHKSTDEVYEDLNLNGIKCVKYHAGMTTKQRKQSHEEFVKDKVNCIVATLAFGMGIDKPDVRNIIHYGTPKDIESYYQEVGRAGRDGLPAKCTLIYSPTDFRIHEFFWVNQGGFLKQKAIEAANTIKKFINSTECRRKFILKYFNDQACRIEDLKPRKNCCDNCLQSLLAPAFPNKLAGVDEKGLYNLTADARLFLQAVVSMGGNFGILKVCYVIKGSKAATVPKKCYNYPVFGKGADKSFEWWKIVGRVLETEGFLQRKSTKSGKFNISTYDLSSKGKTFLQNSNSNLMIAPPLDMKKHLKVVSTITETPLTVVKEPTWISKPTNAIKQNSSASIATNEEENEQQTKYFIELYKLLLQSRNEIAYKEDCSPYMVASNAALLSMSKIRPKTMREFQSYNFDGMTEIKKTKFGPTFLEVITTYCQKNPFNIIETKESDKKTGIENLQQFAFVVNKVKINTSSSQESFEDISDKAQQYSFVDSNPGSSQINMEDDISDEAFNELYDNLDDTFSQLNKNTNNGNETKDSEDDWLDSPKEKQNEDVFEEDSLDSALFNIADKIETVEKNEERIVGNKSKRNEENWCAKKKSHFTDKFLDL